MVVVDGVELEWAPVSRPAVEVEVVVVGLEVFDLQPTEEPVAGF